MFTLSTIQGIEIARVETFREALEYKAGENGQRTSIRWESRQAHTCLDVDSVPSHIVPDTLLSLLSPVPLHSWVSRSGHGLHAIYAADGKYHADEIAALAALHIKLKYPEIQKYELLRHTFRPSDFNQLKSGKQLVDDTVLSRFLGVRQADEDDIRLYLETKGMVIGERYSHAYCPSSPDAKGERDPVIVYDKGIYCHVCNANGKGFFPFDSLCGESIPSDIARMITAKTHWDHARFVLQSILGMTETVCEKVYSAALVNRWGQDIRLERIFWPRRNVLRINRWWGTETGEMYDDSIDAILADLPTCRYKDEKEKEKVDRKKVTILKQTINLSEYGYASLHPIRGMRIYGHNLPYSNRDYTIVFQNHLLTRDDNSRFRPRYRLRPTGQYGITVDAAWNTLESAFPNLPRNCIRLLVAARGVAEGQTGLPPFLYISGPSGASKTSSVMIAAAICGDVNTSIIWTNNIERVRQGILEAKTRGMYVTFNEICKQAEKEAVAFHTALDDILNLTPDSTSHQMYVGPVPLGLIPVCVWTDTQVPVEIRDSIQLARRLIHIHLPIKLEWEDSIRESGVGQIERLRIAGLHFSEACDIILSEVIDDFFREPMDLRAIAEQLGYHTLADEGYEDTEKTLRLFYESWKSAPVLSDKFQMRWRGDGWKLIDLAESNGKLNQLWDALRNTDNPKESRRCSEANWPKIIGVTHPVEFETQNHGTKVVIRFRESKQ